MRLPDESISFQNTTGDSGVENLFVYGKLNYNFDNDDIKARSINISGDIVGSSFSGSGINLTNIPAEQLIGNVADANISALSASKLTGALPAISGANLTGIEAFVQGMIILWYGNTGNVPPGFALCDGNNGTPDLRNRFVVGAGDSYNPNDTGGATSNTLTSDQLPTHSHSASVTDPGHVHSTSFDNKKYFPGGGSTSISFGGAGGYPADTFTMNSQTTGISVSVGNNTTNGDSVENRPPYMALCYIMKT